MPLTQLLGGFERKNSRVTIALSNRPKVGHICVSEITALYHTHKEARISAIPTFIIEGQRLQGLQSKETLERVIDFAQRP